MSVRKQWTSDEVAMLRLRYLNERTENIALDLGRTLRQVYNKAAVLGLKKSVAYLDSSDACPCITSSGAAASKGL